MMFAALILSAAAALADPALVSEIRKLRASLPPGDPARQELDLRLADELFSESVRKGISGNARREREEALLLYRDGSGSVRGEAREKIRFQMARLLADLGRKPEALAIFRDLAKDAEVIPLKREALLRLAEDAEERRATDEAQRAYDQVLELCAGTDICSFAHYRLAWVNRARGDWPKAIAHLEIGLRDSKGQVREEALRDWIAFMGQDPARATAHVAKIDALSAQLGRPQLLDQLADAYFGSGHRKAGAEVLELIQARRPTLVNALKLMEQAYADRDWDRFRSHLATFTAEAAAPKGAASADAEKLARRLALQLDGDRKTEAAHGEEFRAVVEGYLALFPRSPDRFAMVDGWVASESDPGKRIARLESWSTDARFAWTDAERKRIALQQLGVAEKASLQPQVVRLAGELAALPGVPPAEVRKYRYAAAYARMKSGDGDGALAEFRALALGGADEWGVQSQHLALELLNQRHDLAGIVAQAEAWKGDAKSSQEMKGIREQALFETAVAAAKSEGSRADALARFTDFCVKGAFLPKSCDNARTLAIELKRQPELIAVLKLAAARAPAEVAVARDLADELESAGHFAEAADRRARAPLAPAKPTFEDLARMAVLRELAQDEAGLARVRAQLLKQGAPDEPREGALLDLLHDSGLVDDSALRIFRSAERRESLAETLYAEGRAGKHAREALMSAKILRGPMASRLALEEARARAERADRIAIHGRGAQKKFLDRVAAIKELNRVVQSRYAGAPRATRLGLLRVLRASLEKLHADILASPMPPGLNDEQLAQVKGALAEMAAPFAQQLADLKSTADQELAAETDPVQQAAARAAWDATAPAEAPIETRAAAPSPKLDAARYAALLAPLRDQPRDRAALEALRDFTRAGNRLRLSRYFEGRLNSL